MEEGRGNSMESVALTLNARSRYGDDICIICDDGAANPALPNLTTVPANLGKTARNRAVLARLKAFRPQIVEYHQQLGPAAEIAKAMPGPVHVLYRHTRIKPPSNPIERYRYRRRLQAFDHLLFVSETASAEFLADYPGFKWPVSAVCNPIDVDVWRADADGRERLILFSGRALPEKGLDAFCEALAGVLERNDDWRGALLLGDWERHAAWAGPHIARLERFGDRIEIHRSAPMAKVVEVTRRAAIAVTPSRVAEALGLTALEAHAAGAALISSGRGGLREASGDHAVYVDPPEAEGLAAAMQRLMDDPALRADLARAGQAFVVANHAPDVRAAQLDDLRRRLVTSASPQSVRDRGHARELTGDPAWAD